MGFTFNFDAVVLIMVWIGLAMFLMWYIANEIGLYSFTLTILFFSSIIFFYLYINMNWWIMFIGWEMIRVCSFFLIGHYTYRRKAIISASMAILINRFRDIIFLLFII